MAEVAARTASANPAAGSAKATIPAIPHINVSGKRADLVRGPALCNRDVVQRCVDEHGQSKIAAAFQCAINPKTRRLTQRIQAPPGKANHMKIIKERKRTTKDCPREIVAP